LPQRGECINITPLFTSGAKPLARYKRIDTSPRFIAVDLQRKLLPGTFEHALNHLIDREPIRLSPQAGKSLAIPLPPPQG